MKKYMSFAVVVLLTGCFFPREESDPFPMTNYEPIFMSRPALESSIKVHKPRDIEQSGKIYIWGNYLFVNEPHKGIHVFDNSNGETPIALGFIAILGNIDISIKDGILLADNATDLISMDISNINNIRVVKRLYDVFPELTPPDNFFIPNEFLPPNRPDSLIIVDWKIR